MTLQEFTARLIAVFEGERLTAYQDTGGIWTIGIGHTGPDVVGGLVISHEDSVQLFAADTEHLFTMVGGMPVLKAAAMVSFGYNCGPTALQLVLDGKDAIDNPRHFTDRHGNILPGLQARRLLEYALVATGGTMQTGEEETR